MKILLKNLILTLALLNGGAVHATGYYVATSGNNANPGSFAQPWRTVQHAANTLLAGDSVIILSGTYVEKVAPQNSGQVDAWITYSAYPGDEVIIYSSDTTLSGYCIALLDSLRNMLLLLLLRLKAMTSQIHY